MSLRTGITCSLITLTQLLVRLATGLYLLKIHHCHNIATVGKGAVSNERAGHCAEPELLLTVATMEAGLLAIDPCLR